MNQSMTPSYQPSALMAGGTVVGTDPAGSNRGGTTRPGQPIAFQTTRASTSRSSGDTDCARPLLTSGRSIEVTVGTGITCCE
jgi:hypothetical protein